MLLHFVVRNRPLVFPRCDDSSYVRNPFFLFSQAYLPFELALYVNFLECFEASSRDRRPRDVVVSILEVVVIVVGCDFSRFVLLIHLVIYTLL